MRTAHLIVSATAFAAMLAAYLVHIHDHPSDAQGWYVHAPISVLPAVWSMLGYFATRRGGRLTHLSQLVSACLILCLSLWALRNSVYEWQFVRNNVDPNGHKVIPGLGAASCWLLAALIGLISFVSGVLTYFDRLPTTPEGES
jgi:hypothetical protein